MTTVPFAEPGDVDRAENLVRFGEARQHVLEIAALDRLGELANQCRLGGARRPVQKEMLPGDQGQGNQIDDLFPAHETLLQRLHDFISETVDNRILHENLE